MRCFSHLVDYGDHSQQIHEWLASLSVIDQTDLGLGLRTYAVFEIQNSIIVAVLSLDAGSDSAVRRLQEAAVLTDDFVSVITC